MAIISIIWLNHNINFIQSSIKTLVLIYYITNYAIKKDYSQYQRIIATVIIKKIFKNQKKNSFRLSFYSLNIDKFLLKIFNRLSYNYKISKVVIARFLLNIPDYYTLNVLIKSINISILKAKFLLLISKQNFNTTNNVTYINSSKIRLYFMFKHYFYKGLCFL